MPIIIPAYPWKPKQPSSPTNGPMPLRSAWWRHERRLQEAKTQPYRSMKEGRDTGTEALQTFQSGLLLIRGQRSASDKPYCYEIPESEHNSDSARCVYGPFTRRAVASFQQQAKIASDGIGGQTTLSHLDAALVKHYDALLPPSNGGGGQAPQGNTPSPSSTTGGA